MNKYFLTSYNIIQINRFQGLVIFVILVCKKNVIEGLKGLWYSNLRDSYSPSLENEMEMRSYSQGSQISSKTVNTET